MALTWNRTILFGSVTQRLGDWHALGPVLQGLSGDDSRQGAGLELLVERLSNFRTNDEFLDEIGRAKS